MKFTRRQTLAAALGSLGAGVLPRAQAQTQPFPSQVIKFVIPTPAGGGHDTMMRIIGQKMTDAWGQPCIVASRSGASGAIAAATVSQAPAGGYTVLGAPTLVARIQQAGTDSQLAARLVDVSPDGLTKTLIARALWRPAGSGIQVFQLHANGYRVEEGHVARLELLAKDASLPAGGVLNYGRPSNNQTEATVSDVDLRVPVAEKPGSLGGLVTAPAPKVLPDRPGAALAPGYGKAGSLPIDRYVPPRKTRLKLVGALKLKGKKLKVRAYCPRTASSCPKTVIRVRKGKAVLASRQAVKVGVGKTRNLNLKLTRKGRRAVTRKAGKRRLVVRVSIRTRGVKPATVKRTVRVPARR